MERKNALDEIKAIRDAYKRQKELQADYEWEQQSRQFHWQNTMAQLSALSGEKPKSVPFKTLVKGHYEGDLGTPYVKNYSHRNVPLKRDPRVVLDGKELESDSRLQVAPHSRRFIKPETLLSKTPLPRISDKVPMGPSSAQYL